MTRRKTGFHLGKLNGATWRYTFLALATLALLYGLFNPDGIGTWGASSTLTVCPTGCDYSSIQAAIEAAKAGATITIQPGTYQENLEITTRELTIQGVDAAQVIVRAADPAKPVVTISRTREVKMSKLALTEGSQGLQVQRCFDIFLEDLIVSGNAREGIVMELINGGELRGSLIQDNEGSGVSLKDRTQYSLSTNRILNSGRHGLEILNSKVELRGNLIRGSGECGLFADADSTLAGGDNGIAGNHQDLCEAAAGHEELLDRTPPGLPGNLKVNPADWTNRSYFELTWDDPQESLGIVASWFKLGSEPASPEDGTRSTERPLVIENVPEGRTPIYLWLEDGAGNKDHEQSAQTILLFDKTLPTIKAVILPEPNAHGWNNTEASISFECQDQLSEIKECPAPVTLGTEGRGQLVKGEAIDRAGNKAEVSLEVNIDKTSPTVTAGEPQGKLGENGWFIADVQVSFTAEDKLSGLADASQVSFTRLSQGEGSELYVSSSSIYDLAGNKAEAKAGPFKVDKTPPMITAALKPQPNEHNWNNTDVVVSFTCQDMTSGIAHCTEPITLVEEGKGQLVRGEVADQAGHRTAAQVEANIDKTSPVIILGQPQGVAGDDGWYRSDVQVPFTATDNLAGFAPDGRITQDGTRNSSGEGADVMVKVSVEDLAGNSAAGETGPFKVDKTPPTIEATPSPRPNSNGWNNATVTVSFECGDRTSGIISCTSPITLSQEGKGQQAKGEAVDKAGNRSTATITLNIDETAPLVELSISGGAYAGGLTARWSASDDLSGLASCRAWVDGNRVSGDCSGSRSLGTGSHSVKIEAEDKAGNINSASQRTSEKVLLFVSAEWASGSAYRPGIYRLEQDGFTSKTRVTSQFKVPLDGACGPDSLVYFADQAGNKIIRFEQDGDQVETVAEINGPVSLAFSPEGDLFVNTTSQGVWKVDMANNEPVGKPEQITPLWGSGLSSLGPWSSWQGNAGGIAFIHTGQLAGSFLVVDTAGKRVLRFDPPDFSQPVYFITTFRDGFQEKHFSTPVGIAINSSGDIFVADANARKMFQFGPDGSFKRALPLTLYIPAHLEIDFSDNIYLTQWGLYVGEGQVVKISPEGDKLELLAKVVDAWGIALCTGTR